LNDDELMKMIREFDLRKEECPIPFMKAMRELSKASIGEELIFIVEDEKCIELIEGGAKIFSQSVEKVEKLDKLYKIYVRKTGEFKLPSV